MDRNLLLLLKGSVILALCILADCGCIFEERERSVGEVWHPSTFGTCVNCTCQLNEKGEPEVSCVNTVNKCPKLTCDNPKKDPNMCCPYCEVQTGDDESSSSSRASCKGPSGKVYKDGERYSSNTTGLKPTSDKQCVSCVCLDGQSLCHLKTCSIPGSCSAYLEPDHDCCPVCADCADGDGLKKNGSTWHPTIASIGEIACITCTCLNGEIKCRKDCVPDHELPCRHPKKPNGECCKTCPLTDPDTDTTTSKPKQKDRKQRNGKGKGRGKGKGKKKKNRKRRCRKDKDKKCKNKRHRNRKKGGKGSVNDLVAKVTAAPGVDLDTLCLKKRTQYLMYKVQTATEMAIGFDDIRAGTVDVYKWAINKDNNRELVSYTDVTVISSPVYRRSINNTNVIGTIGNKQYRKFKKRLKQKLDRCKLECDPKLFIKIVQRIKVNLLKFGDDCKT